MLRISTDNGAQQVRLKLEGKLAGVWVDELEDAWREAESTRNGRSLCLDLSAVEHVDRAGEYLLALVALSGGELIASGAMTGELCRKIAAGWPRSSA